MNKEGINNYNVLLVTYVNEFVSYFENSSDVRVRNTNNMIDNLEKQLADLNIVIQRDQIFKIIDNSFVMYTNILKRHFDSSGIHKINPELKNEELAKEINEVTTNLSKALSSSNKSPEFSDLLKKIKDTITYVIANTSPNYKGHEYEVSQILNDVVNSFYLIYTTDKIDIFNRDRLSELYKMCDAITYNIGQDEDKPDTYPNEGRDNYIKKTMNLVIHEEVKDGLVTLTTVDGFGNRKDYFGKQAIDQLKSYNKLYESSKPGRKADTSSWPSEKEMEENENATRETPEETMTLADTSSQFDLMKSVDELNREGKLDEDNKNIKVTGEEYQKLPFIQTDNTFFNNLTLPSNGDFTSSYGNSYNQPSGYTNIDTSYNGNEQMIKDFMSKYNNETISANNNMNISSDVINPLGENITIPGLAPTVEAKSNNRFLPDNYSTTPQNMTNLVQPTNQTINMGYSQSQQVIPEQNQFITNPQVQGIPEIDANGFISQYENPNYDRDQFIKRATGITLEEDIDHNGRLFCRIIEPSGHEVVYTGKNAASMIRNYNKMYLDANPGKKVDTRLIDRYN